MVWKRTGANHGKNLLYNPCWWLLIHALQHLQIYFGSEDMSSCILICYYNGRYSFYIAPGLFNNKGITQAIKAFLNNWNFVALSYEI